MESLKTAAATGLDECRQDRDSTFADGKSCDPCIDHLNRALRAGG
ncbi:MAG: hypothetical protein O3C65_15150 [Proteobacteria bacterium]|nr:hypothetical protein [Pseudomonadota bacterium]MDA1060011.1 hypothetical protein [Pseudomonadota bacterium]